MAENNRDESVKMKNTRKKVDFIVENAQQLTAQTEALTQQVNGLNYGFATISDQLNELRYAMSAGYVENLDYALLADKLAERIPYLQSSVTLDYDMLADKVAERMKRRGAAEDGAAQKLYRWEPSQKPSEGNAEKGSGAAVISEEQSPLTASVDTEETEDGKNVAVTIKLGDLDHDRIAQKIAEDIAIPDYQEIMFDYDYLAEKIAEKTGTFGAETEDLAKYIVKELDLVDLLSGKFNMAEMTDLMARKMNTMEFADLLARKIDIEELAELVARRIGRKWSDYGAFGFHGGFGGGMQIKESPEKSDWDMLSRVVAEKVCDEWERLMRRMPCPKESAEKFDYDLVGSAVADKMRDEWERVVRRLDCRKDYDCYRTTPEKFDYDLMARTMSDRMRDDLERIAGKNVGAQSGVQDYQEMARVVADRVCGEWARMERDAASAEKEATPDYNELAQTVADKVCAEWSRQSANEAVKAQETAATATPDDEETARLFAEKVYKEWETLRAESKEPAEDPGELAHTVAEKVLEELKPYLSEQRGEDASVDYDLFARTVTDQVEELYRQSAYERREEPDYDVLSQIVADKVCERLDRRAEEAAATEENAEEQAVEAAHRDLLAQTVAEKVCLELKQQLSEREDAGEVVDYNEIAETVANKVCAELKQNFVEAEGPDYGDAARLFAEKVFAEFGALRGANALKEEEPLSAYLDYDLLAQSLADKVCKELKELFSDREEKEVPSVDYEQLAKTVADKVREAQPQPEVQEAIDYDYLAESVTERVCRELKQLPPVEVCAESVDYEQLSQAVAERVTETLNFNDRVAGGESVDYEQLAQAVAEKVSEEWKRQSENDAETKEEIDVENAVDMTEAENAEAEQSGMAAEQEDYGIVIAAEENSGSADASDDAAARLFAEKVYEEWQTLRKEETEDSAIDYELLAQTVARKVCEEWSRQAEVAAAQMNETDVTEVAVIDREEAEETVSLDETKENAEATENAEAIAVDCTDGQEITAENICESVSTPDYEETARLFAEKVYEEWQTLQGAKTEPEEKDIEVGTAHFDGDALAQTVADKVCEQLNRQTQEGTGSEEARSEEELMAIQRDLLAKAVAERVCEGLKQQLSEREEAGEEVDYYGIAEIVANQVCHELNKSAAEETPAVDYEQLAEAVANKVCETMKGQTEKEESAEAVNYEQLAESVAAKVCEALRQSDTEESEDSVAPVEAVDYEQLAQSVADKISDTLQLSDRETPVDYDLMAQTVADKVSAELNGKTKEEAGSEEKHSEEELMAIQRDLLAKAVAERVCEGLKQQLSDREEAGEEVDYYGIAEIVANQVCHELNEPAEEESPAVDYEQLAEAVANKVCETMKGQTDEEESAESVNYEQLAQTVADKVAAAMGESDKDTAANPVDYELMAQTVADKVCEGMRQTEAEKDFSEAVDYDRIVESVADRVCAEWARIAKDETQEASESVALPDYDAMAETFAEKVYEEWNRLHGTEEPNEAQTDYDLLAQSVADKVCDEWARQRASEAALHEEAAAADATSEPEGNVCESVSLATKSGISAEQRFDAIDQEIAEIKRFLFEYLSVARIAEAVSETEEPTDTEPLIEEGDANDIATEEENPDAVDALSEDESVETEAVNEAETEEAEDETLSDEEAGAEAIAEEEPEIVAEEEVADEEPLEVSEEEPISEEQSEEVSLDAEAIAEEEGGEPAEDLPDTAEEEAYRALDDMFNDDLDDDDLEGDDDEPEDEPVGAAGEEEEEDEGETTEIDAVTGFVYKIRYNRSFVARMKQCSVEQKRYYGEVRNALLAYEKVNSNVAWCAERFHMGRETIARIRVRGTTLVLCLALDPAAYEESVYHQEDVSQYKSMAGTPLMVKLKSPRGVKKAKRLIADMFAARDGVKKIPGPNDFKPDYIKMYPYASRDELIEKGLIKVRRRKQ